jgi:DNA-binding NarL/FixJ family response regulator
VKSHVSSLAIFEIESARYVLLRVDSPHGDPLSARERQVALLLADGRENREVAAALGITENTVSAYVRRIYRKLRVHSRRELALHMALLDRLAAPSG